MKLGFSGSSEGMSLNQLRQFYNFIKTIEIDEFHHGDCVGADLQAHFIIAKIRPHSIIIIHPPKAKDKRAFCEGDEYREPKRFLERNGDIVVETELLIAAPLSTTEVLRSGTWATIRYARKFGRQLIILPR